MSSQNSNQVIALDIGGGSTQISWGDKNEEPLNQILLPYGGSSFKNELSQFLYGEIQDTVNPILGKDSVDSKESKEQKLLDIYNHFKVSLLKKERSNSIGKFNELSSQKSVFAIGSLINNSVCPVACTFIEEEGKVAYNVIYLSKLEEAIFKSITLDDESLLKNLSSRNDKKFVNIAVSNLILLYTYMKLLGIESIRAIEANLDTVLIKMQESTHITENLSEVSFDKDSSKEVLSDSPFTGFFGFFLRPNFPVYFLGENTQE